MKVHLRKDGVIVCDPLQNGMNAPMEDWGKLSPELRCAECEKKSDALHGEFLQLGKPYPHFIMNRGMEFKPSSDTMVISEGDLISLLLGYICGTIDATDKDAEWIRGNCKEFICSIEGIENYMNADYMDKIKKWKK